MNPTDMEYTLARELTDLPDEVRAAPAPVIPDVSEPFGLRLVDSAGDDPETIAEWMSRPHLLSTWEQPWPASRRRADCRAQLAGTYSRPCILSLDYAAIDRPELGRRDIGYLELYRAAKDEIARLYVADPHDIGFHIATADPELLGRGVIPAVMMQLMAAIFAADPRCRRIMGDPDHRNAAVLRAAEKEGWQHLGLFDVRPDRRIALVTLPRTPQDIPSIR
ncbi:GNAT family N-acetyltransferase [Nocardia sp. NPDC051787]|uniref:GNAT family N-acetyltransferase n=1 Tax=Nocardia sp. NPDC051787 TaxID=3155415 RepID=UPI00343A3BA7